MSTAKILAVRTRAGKAGPEIDPSVQTDRRKSLRHPHKEAHMTKTNATPVHISVLLDRSGSMSSIASDIVGGFNSFLDEQRKQPGDARLTLVQFDTGDPFEVVIDGKDLGRVPNMPAGAFVPRGGTPLLDAVARLITRTDGEIAARATVGSRSRTSW